LRAELACERRAWTPAAQRRKIDDGTRTYLWKIFGNKDLAAKPIVLDAAASAAKNS